MSVLRLEDFNRDPFDYLRRLERLSRLDADRCALISKQKAGAASGTAKTVPPHLASTNSGATNNPENGNAA